MQAYAVLAATVLLVHLAYILWVVLGWIWTRRRPFLAALHIASLLWGIVVELGPWPCPLTALEQYLETRAGMTPYRGSFILHWLDALIYPNVPYLLVACVGAGICGGLFAIYIRRWATSAEDGA